MCVQRLAYRSHCACALCDHPERVMMLIFGETEIWVVIKEYLQYDLQVFEI